VKYRIVIGPLARRDIRDASRYIATTAPLNARRWYYGAYKAVESLADLPERCPIAPDSQFVGTELRHLIYKSHRIIFWIDHHKQTVHIVAVRHGAQRHIGQSELPGDHDN
jgi:plasmid stabilization system protein ParE